jgi:lysyl-tRNA synthetase class 2
VAKALRPLPEKWHGLTDPEQVYRQRYLDLIVNPESRQRLLLRSRIVSHIRRFLEDRKFIEVETPVLQAWRAARRRGRSSRTTTRSAAISSCASRSSCYLKRLLVGGYDRVFEIGRIFRNEGVSRKHNPEFTMLEVYQAYSDHRGMMTLIKDLLTTLCRDVLGTDRDQARRERAGDQLRRRVARGERYKDLIRPRRAIRRLVQPAARRKRSRRREARPQAIDPAGRTSRSPTRSSPRRSSRR